MRESSGLAFNYILFALFTCLASGLQSSLWLQIFGSLVPPQFWLTVLVYWALYRGINEGLIMTYFLALMLTPFTSMPFGMLLIVSLTILSLCTLVKGRIFWSTATYFMLACGLSSLFFPWLHWLFSLMFEPNPIHKIRFFDVLIQGLLTSLVALPLFGLYRKIDVLTDKTLPTEMSTSDDEFLP